MTIEDVISRILAKYPHYSKQSKAELRKRLISVDKLYNPRGDLFNFPDYDKLFDYLDDSRVGKMSRDEYIEARNELFIKIDVWKRNRN